jgi:DNA-nicking Smr family endonuclease
MPQHDDGGFQDMLEGVTPLKPTNRMAPAAAQRPAIVRDQHDALPVADTLSDCDTDSILLTEFRRDGISPMTLRKLRRGQFPVQDTLDLHGLNSNAARKLLQEFLSEAIAHSLRCIHIIHGKGYHTQGGEGLLKHRTRHWLTQHPEVLAFCETPPRAGGSGAVWVLLKTRSTKP